MDTFFYSDPHFGHKRLLDFRPFHTVQEMDAALIHRYNSMVGPNDLVFWLGDCSFHKVDKTREIFASLNGTKILYLGNHDRGAGAMASLGFAAVHNEGTMSIAGETVRLSHFPPKHFYDPRYKGADTRHAHLRPQMNKGEWLLHGHTHGTEIVQGKCIHVGVDAWDYAPVRLADVERVIVGLGPISLPPGVERWQ